MVDSLRHPALPVGVLLFVLGIGNWLVSHNKLVEYRHRMVSVDSMEARRSAGRLPSPDSAHQRDAARPLHRGATDSSRTVAKLDFYGVVQNGGRFFSLVGFALIAVAVVQSQRESRRKLAV